MEGDEEGKRRGRSNQGGWWGVREGGVGGVREGGRENE